MYVFLYQAMISQYTCPGCHKICGKLPSFLLESSKPSSIAGELKLKSPAQPKIKKATKSKPSTLSSSMKRNNSSGKKSDFAKKGTTQLERRVISLKKDVFCGYLRK